MFTRVESSPAEDVERVYGDIEFYYVLTVGKGVWKLKVCTAHCPDFDKPVTLRTLHRSQALARLTIKYPDKWNRSDEFKRLQGLQVGMDSVDLQAFANEMQDLAFLEYSEGFGSLNPDKELDSDTLGEFVNILHRFGLAPDVKRKVPAVS